MTASPPVRARGVALVTGASAGIGKVFCARLAARGYDLLLVARDARRLEALASELEARYETEVDVLPADLTVDADVDRVIARLRDTPRLALLVNNAGFGSWGVLAEADPAQQAAMVRLHSLAPMRLMQAALPGMSRRGEGAVVNVASIAAFILSAGNANYCATKAYLVSLSESVAAEVAGTGVRVQALCPGFTHTEFHHRMAMDKRQIPSWAWMTAERVVDDSLAALDRGGPVVVVPGIGYRMLVQLIRFSPRWVVARVARTRR